MRSSWKKKILPNVKVSHRTYASTVASLTILMASFWSAYISPVLLKFEKREAHFQLTAVEITWIVSILDLGTLLGPIPAGVLMSVWGRKHALIISSIMYLAASLFAVFSTGGHHLFTARFLSGLAKGFSFTVSPLYVAEISSKTVGGAALNSLFYAFFCMGTLLVWGVGPYVSFQNLNYIGLSLPILFLMLMLPLPESPHYYLMTNREHEAEKALKWFRDISTKREQFMTDGELAEMKISLRETKRDGTYGELLGNAAYKEVLLVVTVVGLAQHFGGISYFLSYAAKDLPDSGTIFGRKQCFTVFALVSLFANVVAGLATERIGRKPILAVSTIAASIGLSIGAAYFTVVREPIDRTYGWIPYSVVIAFSITFACGFGIIPATFQSEIFPPEIKRHASAIVVMISSLGSFSVNITHDIVVERLGVAGNYYFAAISSVIFAFWSYKYVFEAKKKMLVKTTHDYFTVYAGHQIRAQNLRNQNTSPIIPTTEYGRGIIPPLWKQKAASGSALMEMENTRKAEFYVDKSEKFYLSEFKSMSLGDLTATNAKANGNAKL